MLLMLLPNALLKRVVTEIVLFSVVAFKTLTQGSVATHLRRFLQRLPDQCQR